MLVACAAAGAVGAFAGAAVFPGGLGKIFILAIILAAVGAVAGLLAGAFVAAAADAAPYPYKRPTATVGALLIATAVAVAARWFLAGLPFR